MRDLPRIVAQSTVGQKSKVEIWRDGKKKTVTVKTDPYPDDETVAGLNRGSSSPDADEDNEFGARLSELTVEYRQRLSIADEVEGVVVLEVAPDGLAAQNGIRRGDVITTVNNITVSEPDDVFAQIESAQKKGRDKIVVLLQRNNGSRFIPFDLSE